MKCIMWLCNICKQKIKILLADVTAGVQVLCLRQTAGTADV